MREFIEGLLCRLRGGVPLSVLKRRGLRIGTGVSIQPRVVIDPSHCWLISIGNNVTLAPQAYILAHDASTKRALGYTRVARVSIGDNTFVGACAVIMPGVKVGADVIVAAGSVVVKDVLDGSVVAGNPAAVIGKTAEYLEKHRGLMTSRPCFDRSYTVAGRISDAQQDAMREKLADGPGYVE